MDKLAKDQVLDIISKNTDDCLIITNDNGHTTWVNDKFPEVTGYKKDEVIGEKPGELLQGENTDQKTINRIRKALRDKKEFSCELLNYTKQCKPYWIELRIFPFENSEGELNFLGIKKDITSSSLHKSPLINTGNVHNLLLDNFKEIISLHTLDADVIYISPSCESVLGYSQEELIGQPIFKYLPEDDAIRIRKEALSKAKKGISPPIQRFQFIKKNGSNIWLESNVSVIGDKNGKPIKIQSFARDVTEKMMIQESLEFQANIFKNISDTVIACDENGLINYWSRSAEKTHGIKAEEMIGENISNFDPNFNFSSFKANYKKYLESPLHYQWKYESKDQERIWIDATIRPLLNSQGQFKGCVGVGKNNTELIESKLRLDSALEGADIGLWDYNIVMKTNKVCERWCSMIGYKKNEVQETQAFFLDHMHPDDRQLFKDAVSKIQTDPNHKIDITFRLRNKSGDYQWINKRGKAIEFDEKGNPVRIIGTHQDVTKRVQLMRLLRATNELANVGGWELNAKTGNHFVTEGIKKVFALKKMIKNHDEIFKYYHKDDRQIIESKFEHLLKTGEGYDLELKITDGNGLEKWIRSIARGEVLNGRVINTYGAIQDITLKKRMEERLNVTGELAQIGGWEHNLVTDETILTDQVYTIYGIPLGTLLKTKEGMKFYHPEDLPIIKKTYNELIKKGKPYDTELRFIDAKGNNKWIRTHGRCEKVNGKVVRTYGSIQDITENKRLENLLRLTNSMAKVGGIEISLPDNSIIVTDEVQKIFETDKDLKFHLDNRFNFFSEDSWNTFSSALQKLKTEGGDLDLTLDITTFKKKKKWIRIIGLSEDKNGKPIKIYGSVQDVSDQVQTQQKIADSLKATDDLRYALDESSIVAITDYKGTINYVNNAFIKITGYSKDELIGENHRIINSSHHSKAFFKKMWSTISSGKVWRGEIKNKKKNGKHYWVDTTIVPILDKKQKPKQYIAIRNEITKRKKFQERLRLLNKELENKVQERTADLEQSNKELQTFNYMISHDIRTPLRAVSIFTNQLKKKLEKKLEDEVIEEVDFIDSGVKEMNRLINDLLEYAKFRKNTLKLEKTDITPIVNFYFREYQILYNELEAEIKIDEFPIINLDESLFAHVLSNLIGNAFKYASKDKKLKIHIAYKKKNGKHLLEVEDNGKGFDSKYAEKIFKPFNRLVGHNHSEGSGLGLSICERIIKQHGGEIWAESEEGKGAKFCIKLPVNQNLDTRKE